MNFPANNQTNFADLNKYSTQYNMPETTYENIHQHPQICQQPYNIYDSTPVYPSTPVNECNQAVYKSTPVYPPMPVNECNQAVGQSMPVYQPTPVNEYNQAVYKSTPAECNQAVGQSMPVYQPTPVNECNQVVYQSTPVYQTVPVYQQPYTYDSTPVYPSTPVYQSVVPCDTIYHINNLPYICYASNPNLLYPLQYVQQVPQNSRGFGELAETVGNLAQDKIESLESYVKDQEQQLTNNAQNYVKKSCFSFA